MVPKLWFHERKVGNGTFILHNAQDHNYANFGHFKLFNSQWFKIPSCCGVTIMGKQHGSLNMILHCKLEKMRTIGQAQHGLSMAQQTL
jgi:hypothetical protein